MKWYWLPALAVLACNSLDKRRPHAPPQEKTVPVMEVESGPEGEETDGGVPDGERAEFAEPPAELTMTPVLDPAEFPTAEEVEKWYPWERRRKDYESLATRVHPPPPGFVRQTVKRGTWPWWLRHLPVLVSAEPLRYFDGTIASKDLSRIAAIVDLDTGTRDLQQCMDVLVRLRAEYMMAAGRGNSISFRYVGGRYYSLRAWRNGFRPNRSTREYKLEKTAGSGYGRANFMRYLRVLFHDTGTIHFQNEPRVKPEDLRSGDFFVYPPPAPDMNGHAVMVLDIAENAKGERAVLIGQGDTPAMDFHVLAPHEGTAWFLVPPANFRGAFLRPTPFSWDMLRRFRY